MNRPFRKCTYHRPQPPSRTRSARVRCFSFFAFTSSPHDCKKLGNSDLRVKASPLFPSPVKAKKTAFPSRAKHTGSMNCGWRWRVKAGIANSLSARCVGACPFARTEVRMRKRRVSWSAKARASFQKKRTGRREKKGRFVRKSTSFYSASPHSQKPKHFSHKAFDSSKLNPYFCAW